MKDVTITDICVYILAVCAVTAALVMIGVTVADIVKSLL